MAGRLGPRADLRVSEKYRDFRVYLFLIGELRPPGVLVPDKEAPPSLLDLLDDASDNLDLRFPGRSEAMRHVLRFDETAKHGVSRMAHHRLAWPEDDVVR